MRDSKKERRARRHSWLRRADLRPRPAKGGGREKARRRKQVGHLHNVIEGSRLTQERAEFVKRVGDNLPSLQWTKQEDA
jgi:hypothetical protein